MRMIDILAKALWDHMQQCWPDRIKEEWDAPPKPEDITYWTKREFQRQRVRVVLGGLRNPPEGVWSDLARDLVMWDRFPHPTGSALYAHLHGLGRKIPDWLRAEIPDTDHVPPKGTVAVCIFRAMIEVILAEP